MNTLERFVTSCTNFQISLLLVNGDCMHSVIKPDVIVFAARDIERSWPESTDKTTRWQTH